MCDDVSRHVRGMILRRASLLAVAGSELQQEPLLPTALPSRPFESVSADFFHVGGKSCVIYVDRFSGWPMVAFCSRDTSAAATIRLFQEFFSEMGVPVRLRTDGGPQFSSTEFQSFLARWGVCHDRSTPHYPQSNGHAEAAVKSMKQLVLKVAPAGVRTEDFSRSLLEYRNSPRWDGRSPAQLLFGRLLRSCVPAHPASLAPVDPAWVAEGARRAEDRATSVKEPYDARARPLPPLQVGTAVRIQDPVSRRWDHVGVIERVRSPRAYLIRLPSGRSWWRNRRFLRPAKGPSPELTPSQPSPVAALRRSPRFARR